MDDNDGQCVHGFALLNRMSSSSLFVDQALIVEGFPLQRNSAMRRASTAETEGGGKKSNKHRVHRHGSVSWPLCSPSGHGSLPAFQTRSSRQRPSRAEGRRLKAG